MQTEVGNQRAVIQGRVRKVQNIRQGQGRQRSVILGGVTKDRTAGRLRAGQAECSKLGRQEHGKNKMNWQQTNREHRYKYTGDNGEDGRHLEGGGDKDKGK